MGPMSREFEVWCQTLDRAGLRSDNWGAWDVPLGLAHWADSLPQPSLEPGGTDSGWPNPSGLAGCRVVPATGEPAPADAEQQPADPYPELEIEALKTVHRSEQAQLLVEASFLALVMGQVYRQEANPTPRSLGWPGEYLLRRDWHLGFTSLGGEQGADWLHTELGLWRSRVCSELEMAELDGAAVHPCLAPDTGVRSGQGAAADPVELAREACQLSPGPQRTLQHALALLFAGETRTALRCLDEAAQDPALGWSTDASWLQAQTNLMRAAAFESIGLLASSLASLLHHLGSIDKHEEAPGMELHLALIMALALGDRPALASCYKWWLPAGSHQILRALDPSEAACQILCHRVRQWRERGWAPARLPRHSRSTLLLLKVDSSERFMEVLATLCPSTH